jgi:hypothetical protein
MMVKATEYDKYCDRGIIVGQLKNETFDDSVVINQFYERNPSSISMKNILHYIQMRTQYKKVGKPFREYNYGTTGNMDIYKTAEPPVINLNNINKFKIAMFAARWDELATLVDNRFIRGFI